MKPIKFLLPVLVLSIALLLARQILDSPPEVSSRPNFSRPPSVEAITLKPQSYQVILNSQGTLEPSISNTLVAQVAGTIEALSPSFVTGGLFKEGELLIQLDQRDYQIALTQAKAQLSQAEAQLQEEAARSKQAKLEWESINEGRTPTAINLRQPQLAAATANRDGAAAQVERAELDLQRTQIKAPYDGMVSSVDTNLGQFVSRGSVLGAMHSLDSLDVRLPLSSRQKAMLGAVGDSADSQPSVVFKTEGAEYKGSLVRIEGVDTTTQQFNVIGRINLNDQSRALRSGQFVQAQISGKELEDVYVIPRDAVREEFEVLILEEKSKIQRAPVTVAWRDENSSVVSSGLSEGQLLVTTPLSVVANGTPVSATIDGKPPERKSRPGKPKSADDSSDDEKPRAKPKGDQ